MIELLRRFLPYLGSSELQGILLETRYSIAMSLPGEAYAYGRCIASSVFYVHIGIP